ncbi:hypothetical protein GCM10023199_57490 [Actinomycetospora chibensis]
MPLSAAVGVLVLLVDMGVTVHRVRVEGFALPSATWPSRTDMPGQGSPSASGTAEPPSTRSPVGPRVSRRVDSPGPIRCGTGPATLTLVRRAATPAHPVRHQEATGDSHAIRPVP